MREPQYTATRTGTVPPEDGRGAWTPVTTERERRRGESLRAPALLNGLTLWRREVEVDDAPCATSPAKRRDTPNRLGEHHAALQPVALLVSLFGNAITQLQQGEARLGLRRDGVEFGYVEDEDDVRNRERWLAKLRKAIARGALGEADHLAQLAPLDHEPEGAAFARYLDAIRYALSGAPIGDASLFDLVPVTGRAANKSSADDPNLILGLAVLARIAMSRSESQAQDARRAALSAEERAEARQRKRGKGEGSAAISAPTRQIVAHGYTAWARERAEIESKLAENSYRPALTQSEKGDLAAPLLVARRALVEPPEPIAWAITTAYLAGVPLGIELEPEIIDATEIEVQLAHRLGFADARELNRSESIAQLVENQPRVRTWKSTAASAARREALRKRIGERLRWLLDAEDALTVYRLEEVAAAWQHGDAERAEMLLDYADGWLGLTAQLDRLGARLVSVRDRKRISALLDSVPLALSFAEVRPEPAEVLLEQPLEFEPLEGDESL